MVCYLACECHILCLFSFPEMFFLYKCVILLKTFMYLLYISCHTLEDQLATFCGQLMVIVYVMCCECFCYPRSSIFHKKRLTARQAFKLISLMKKK